MKRVESTKLVGFTFDSKLKFGEMIDKLAKKARVRQVWCNPAPQESRNTKLNNELNKKDDWNAIHEELKNQGVSLNNIGLFTQLNVTCK